MLRTAAAAASAALPPRFAATPAVAAADDLLSPLLRVFGTLRGGRGSLPLGSRARLCSISSASDSEAAAAKAEEAAVEEAAVIALPLLHKPLFPGLHLPVYIKDQKLLQALIENCKRSAPYTGAFLVKDEVTGSNILADSGSESNIDNLKGKCLLKCLHEVGTLAQVTSIQGDQVVLLGHRRIQITEMVEDDPLTVKVDHLKEKPYNKEDDVIKATSFEVISTLLREVLRTSSLWKDHVLNYAQGIGDFNYPRLADFGAAVSGANKSLCQEVLEQSDVCKRLKLTLKLVQKDMEIIKLQQAIAQAFEEKVSGDQQLEAIKELRHHYGAYLVSTRQHTVIGIHSVISLSQQLIFVVSHIAHFKERMNKLLP